MRIQIPLGDGRSVAAITDPPAQGRPPVALLLAHGAGSDLDDPVLAAVHGAAAILGFGVVRFRFPFREEGRLAADSIPVLEDAYTRVVRWALSAEGLGARLLVLGGSVLGARVAALCAAASVPCAGLLLLGYPLHESGTPDTLRDHPLYLLEVPMLFVVGESDPECRLDRLEGVLNRLGKSGTVQRIAGAPPSWGARGGGKARRVIASASASFLGRLLAL